MTESQKLFSHAKNLTSISTQPALKLIVVLLSKRAYFVSSKNEPEGRAHSCFYSPENFLLYSTHRHDAKLYLFRANKLRTADLYANDFFEGDGMWVSLKL